jgi:hypothetical protein
MLPAAYCPLVNICILNTDLDDASVTAAQPAGFTCLSRGTFKDRSNAVSSWFIN